MKSAALVNMKNMWEAQILSKCRFKIFKLEIVGVRCQEQNAYSLAAKPRARQNESCKQESKIKPPLL